MKWYNLHNLIWVVYFVKAKGKRNSGECSACSVMKIFRLWRARNNRMRTSYRTLLEKDK
jgi:hypothetical protein